MWRMCESEMLLVFRDETESASNVVEVVTRSHLRQTNQNCLLRVSGRWNEPWKLSVTTVEVKVNKGCENLCVCHVIVE